MVSNGHVTPDTLYFLEKNSFHAVECSSFFVELRCFYLFISYSFNFNAIISQSRNKTLHLGK